MKIFKNIVDEKQVGIKEAIKIISSLNAPRKLLTSEVLKLVKLILLVPKRSRSTLCRVCIYCWLLFKIDFVLNCVASTGLEIALFWKIFPLNIRERAEGLGCAFVLVVIVFCGSRFLSYLLLFLDCHISNSIICIIVSVSFLVSLFVFLTFSVSKCCCRV